MVSDRVREGLANRDQSPAPVIIDATGENDIAIGNPVGLKYVAARGAFFKETVTGVPKLQGAGAVKIHEIAGQIRGGAIPRYVNQSALQNLSKRIVEVAQRVNEQGIVSFAINEWLESYNVSSGCNGRVVAIPEERRLNWYAFEGSVGVNALKNKAEDLDITVIESQSGAVINEEGRYWICVGPRVLDADYPDAGRLWGDEFTYGTSVDVKIRNTQTGDISYIYAVVGDIRAHTYETEHSQILFVW